MCTRFSFPKNLARITLVFVLAVFFCGASGLERVGASETLSGLGTVVSQETISLYGDFAEQKLAVTTDSSSRPQKVYTVSFDPKNAVRPQVVFGPSVYGKNTLTQLVRYAESSAGGSRNVIAAVNGDYFDMYDGIAFGMTIVDGRLVNNAATILTDSGIDLAGGQERVVPALGFKDDGSVVYGIPDISISVKPASGSPIAVDQVNRRRKADNTWGDVRLLTPDFGATTRSQDPAGTTGKDVVLTIHSADAANGLRIGETIRAIVDSVNETSTSVSTIAIGANKMVLTTVGNKLNSLKSGDELTIEVTDNDENKWKDVRHAMGAYRILAENGIKIEPYGSRTATEPRTALGIRADGSCVFLEADGRQTVATGLSYPMVCDYLINEMNCKTVIELDGGGSSQIMTRSTADSEAVTRNIPSDPGSGTHGTERGLALAWVIVPRADTTMHTVTFKAGINVVQTFEVASGTDFSATHSLPAVPAKSGYVGVWDSEALALLNNVTADIIVAAVYTESTETPGGGGCPAATIPLLGIVLATAWLLVRR